MTIVDYASLCVCVCEQIRVAMITGDSKETAETIAEELGFYEKGADEALSG